MAIQTIKVNLATAGGVDLLIDTIAGRPIDVLCANAGTALGHAFLDQPVAAWRHVVDTNVTGTLLLLHQLLPRMITRGAGRILVTGSINGAIPGPYLAVYNATKAFLNNFTDALRDEIRESTVTLTTLMPGPVETPVYALPACLTPSSARYPSRVPSASRAPDGTRCSEARHISSPGWAARS